jgi:hypothetical protein
MDPYAPQPQNTLQPPPHNPYEFILNPQNPQPKSPGLGKGNFGMMIAFIVGGALLLMLVLGIVVTLFSGSSNTDGFVGLSQTQNELIRVSEQGAADATQQSTKNLAVTAQYGILTQQQQVLAFLAEHGKKVGEKEILLKQNAQTDLQFTAAKSTSTFDMVFSTVMQNQLTTYADNLKQLFNATSDKAERDMLANYHEQTQLLISQIPHTQKTLDSATQ